MLCAKTNLKAGLWLALGIYLNYEIHAKTVKLYKRVQPSKSLGEKSCEIKGDGHEMVAMI